MDFNIVAEQDYREDCSVDVQHICENNLTTNHQPSPPSPPLSDEDVQTLGESLAASEEFQSTGGVLIGVPIETRPSSEDQQLPPEVSVEELPSVPGCRTLSTKTCFKTPVIINKKVII